ncbi:MAG TPA: sporulation protein [Chromatiales bacterium]|nr:sporulation protein [Thiotrichales bacterium]HIP67393.1 sporulation protein [Chromatiales bacterium]
MDKTLKQRLIGAAVIIALAVIFIPMLLEGPKESDPVSMKIDIPEKPVYEIPNRLGTAPAIPTPPTPEPALKAPEVVIPEKPANSSETASPSMPVEKPVKKEAVTEKPVEPPVAAVAPATKTKPVRKRVRISDSGFVVQVGSFSQRQNAMVLSDKLEAAGFPAFVESGKSKDKTIFRVKVGPQPTRADADKLRQKLLETEKLKGIIVAHP